MTAIARQPALAVPLDPKRIAATSLAIAVHAVVLMMLMMPMQMAEPPKVEETPMSVVPIRTIKVPPPPPIPHQRPRPTAEVTHAPPRTPTHVEVVNDDPSPVDPHVDEVTLEEIPGEALVVDPQPSFAQLRADIAPPPGYPAQSIRMRQAGLVMLRVLVDEAGNPREVAIESSSGFRLLDEAAMKVVRKRWHFIPAMQDGRAIQAWALVPVSFELNG